MLGYLVAMENNTELIIDTDDDNIPKSNWRFPPLTGVFDYVPENKGFINIYQLYTSNTIWPRGLPLHLITKDFTLSESIAKKECRIGVWQGLADEDPDVDAIYRLTRGESCTFACREPVVLGEGTLSPFNTQNTMIIKDLFALLYLPTYVTFRFTDILRSLVFQPIMWLYHYNLGFVDATVVQKRNPHDYFKDFISEIPMYEHGEQIIELVSGAIRSSQTIADNLRAAYHVLLRHSIVCTKEMTTLEAWLEDCQTARNS